MTPAARGPDPRRARRSATLDPPVRPKAAPAPPRWHRSLALACTLSACALADPQPARRDLDHDGTYDVGPEFARLDRCPLQPGPGNNHGCPYPDLDGDHVYDHLDRCPFERGGHDGCRDHDRLGSLVAADQCPTYPESMNGYRDDDGCPDELATQLARLTGIRTMSIHFDVLSTTIKPKSLPVLDRLAQILRDFYTVRIEVVCHESRDPGALASGGPGLVKFTLRRADIIKQHLVAAGVAPARIDVRGAGWDEPQDTNRTIAGRARNRRCEFVPLLQ